MAAPYAEKDLLYSLWMGYWNDLNRDFKTHIEAINNFLKEQRIGIEEEVLQFMKQSGMSGTEMVHELESELGHKLYFGGELTKCGVPKMCPMEVAEFLTFGATQKRTIPIMYSIKNSYASYHGAQLLGLIQAFHDHFSENIQTDGMELEESDLDLTNTIGIPFYDYADAGKAQRTLERFIQIFTDNNS